MLSVTRQSRESARMTAAALAFLSTLEPAQRAEATFEFGTDERFRWHYTPIPRRGLSRVDMGPAETAAADELLAASLTSVAARKARQIMDLETVLAEVERSTGVIRHDRTPDLYFFSVFGEPDGQEPWGWRAEGHHLSMHFTVAGGEVVSSTPAFLGAHPAEVEHGPKKGLRVLGDEEDLARDLMASLDTAQTRSAVISPIAPADIVTRADRRVDIGEPVGLPASEMSVEQRQRLASLVGLYLERTAPEVGRSAMRGLEGEALGNVHFAWAGPTARRQGHYYRIHGPSFFAEYDNTQDGANHVHSVWRVVAGDWGEDSLQEHYRRDHA